MFTETGTRSLNKASLHYITSKNKHFTAPGSCLMQHIIFLAAYKDPQPSPDHPLHHPSHEPPHHPPQNPPQFYLLLGLGVSVLLVALLLSVGLLQCRKHQKTIRGTENEPFKPLTQLCIIACDN